MRMRMKRRLDEDEETVDEDEETLVDEDEETL